VKQESKESKEKHLRTLREVQVHLDKFIANYDLFASDDPDESDEDAPSNGTGRKRKHSESSAGPKTKARKVAPYQACFAVSLILHGLERFL
jgi:hypothetical protein